MHKKNLIRVGLFSLIIGLGIALRLYKWSSYSFWYDECLWLGFWKDNFWLSVMNSIYTNKPPLFKLLLCGWSYIAKDEFSLRLLPLLFSLASIILTYQVGKILCDKKTALICCLLMLFSPFHIYYSQELSHHSLTLLLSLCSMYYFVLLLRENKKHLWVKFFLCTTLVLYASYTGIFLLLTENIYYLVMFRKNKHLLKSWLVCQSLLLAACLPLILVTINVYLNFTLYFNHQTWIPAGSLLHILQELRLFNVGYNASALINLLAVLLTVPLFIAGIVVGAQNKKQQIILLTLWLFMPMFLSIVFSGFYHTFAYRNFIFVLPAYYLLIAKGMLNLKRFVYLPVIAFVILSGCALVNYYGNIFPYPENFYRMGIHAKKDNRTPVGYINKNFKTGDMVLHLNRSTANPYFYYSSKAQNLSQGDKYFFREIEYPKPSEGGFVFSDDSKDLLDALRSVSTEDFAVWVEDSAVYKISELLLIENDRVDILKLFIHPGIKRVWLIISAWEPQEFRALLGESNIKRWLGNNFEMLDSRNFSDIEVILYKIS